MSHIIGATLLAVEGKCSFFN